MSSLVDYEDSESEDDSLDQRAAGATDSALTVSCEPNQGTVVCSNLKVRPFPGSLASDWKVWEYQRNVSEGSSSSLRPPYQPQSFTNSERRCGGAAVKDCRDTEALLNLTDTQREIASPQVLPCMPQGLGNNSNSAKRQLTVPSGVRPYIPKRKRLATSETVERKHPTDQVQARETQILSDVSARLKPYLAQEPSTTGIPRRLLMSLGGHQGPVNTVQWCPLTHVSHLLLSASIDKTFKVWDAAESGRCLRVYTCHSGAVRDACWTPCGRHLLTGSFDNTALITDVETGQPAVKVDNEFKVMCVVVHPSNPEVFLCGGYSSMVKAWDSRSCKLKTNMFYHRLLKYELEKMGREELIQVVKVYKAGIQQTLDILFLRGGATFITSSDCVSRDSADRTLIAWDYQTTAKVSNQIYHERYTCPSLALHPLEDSFVAQTNGNYMAVFSSQPPYRMNKRRRFEGHKVEGYAIKCGFSLDGTVLASGSSTGSAHFYDYHTACMVHTLHAHSQPCLCVSQHPILPTTVATCDWAGEIKVWH